MFFVLFLSSNLPRVFLLYHAPVQVLFLYYLRAIYLVSFHFFSVFIIDARTSGPRSYGIIFCFKFIHRFQLLFNNSKCPKHENSTSPCINWTMCLFITDYWQVAVDFLIRTSVWQRSIPTFPLILEVTNINSLLIHAYN